VGGSFRILAGNDLAKKTYLDGCQRLTLTKELCGHRKDRRRGMGGEEKNSGERGGAGAVTESKDFVRSEREEGTQKVPQ